MVDCTYKEPFNVASSLSLLITIQMPFGAPFSRRPSTQTMVNREKPFPERGSRNPSRKGALFFHIRNSIYEYKSTKLAIETGKRASSEEGNWFYRADLANRRSKFTIHSKVFRLFFLHFKRVWGFSIICNGSQFESSGTEPRLMKWTSMWLRIFAHVQQGDSTPKI